MSLSIGLGISLAKAAGTSTPAQQVIIAILTGQSNMAGRNTVDGLNVNRANKFQLDNDSFHTTPPYLTLISDMTELNHPEHPGTAGGYEHRIGAGDQILDDLAVANPSAIIIGVPCAIGGSGFAEAADAFYPGVDSGSSGSGYNGIITATTTAVTLAQAAYPGCTITPIMFVQFGENESGLARSVVATQSNNYVTYARTRLAAATSVSAFSTMEVNFGVPIVEKWFQGYGGYVTTAQQAVVAGLVDTALALSNVNMVAADIPTPLSDHLHFQPASVAREQGAAHVLALSRTDFPTITTTAAQGSVLSALLSIPITHNAQTNPDHLVTAEIVGGADAAEFEIDDAYGLSDYYGPKLRWTGNSTGPVTERDYVVQVALRNSAGAVGTATTLTVTVAAPSVVPVDFTYTHSVGGVNSASGSFSEASVPVYAGLNVFSFFAPSGTNVDATFSMKVNGNTITKLASTASGANRQVWAYESAIDTTVTLSGTWTGAGVLNYYIQAGVVVGADPTPTATDVGAWVNTAIGTAYATASLTCPTDGIIIGIMNVASFTAVTSPTTLVSTNAGGLIFRRDSTGTLAWTAANGAFRGWVALAFAPAP